MTPATTCTPILPARPTPARVNRARAVYPPGQQVPVGVAGAPVGLISVDAVLP